MNDEKNISGGSDPGQWVDRYADDLYRYAMTRLRDPRMAEDIVQETFLAALKARQSFAGKSSEKTWLIGILKNKVIDHFRKTSREVNFDDFADMAAIEGEDFEIEGPNAGSWKVTRRPAEWMIDLDNPLEAKEFWKFLEFCLERMPKQMADLYVLREIDGLDSKEICNEIGINPTNLRVILYRVRKQLRRCLEVNWIEKGKNGR